MQLSITTPYYPLLSVAIRYYQFNTDQAALRVDVHDGTAVNHAADRVCFVEFVLVEFRFSLVLLSLVSGILTMRPTASVSLPFDIVLVVVGLSSPTLMVIK